MCKESIDWSGKQSFDSRERRIAHESPITHLFTGHEMPSDGSICADLYAVTEDGRISCIDGASLDEMWSHSVWSAIGPWLPRSQKGYEVEAVFNDSAVEVMAGLFDNRQDMVASFGRTIDPVEFNPDVIILVVRSLENGSRYLAVVGALARPELETTTRQALAQMHVVPLPSHGGNYLKSSIRLNIRTAKLREIAGEYIHKYDLRPAAPRLLAPMKAAEDLISFVPMSEHTMVTATGSHLTVTNSTYHSTQAQARSVPADQEEIKKPDVGGGLDLVLVTYLYKMDMVIAVGNSKLYAIQLQRNRPHGTDGHMIDAIGTGILTVKELPPAADTEVGFAFATSVLQGTISRPYVQHSMAEADRLDNFLKEGNMREFERNLAAKFKIGIEDEEPTGADGESDDLPEWKWPCAPISVDTFIPAPTEDTETALVVQETPIAPDGAEVVEKAAEEAAKEVAEEVVEEVAEVSPESAGLLRASRRLYPDVDRRWVTYAISRVFELVEGDNGRPRLELYLQDSNVLTYLVVAGHLHLGNIRAAFQVEYIEAPEVPRKELAEQLIHSLIDVDPSRALLLSFLTATTNVGEVELLIIIRNIMRNLVEQPRLPFPREDEDVEDEEHLSLEIELLERELERAEYKLVDESDIHARLLTAAFEKLASFPPKSMVKAMRLTLTPIEILSLIHLLRIQLVGSAWTTKYSDNTGLDKEDSTQRMPDGAIALIAELLSRCIDAVGNNGWLTSRSTEMSMGGRFITALKLEVSAAVDGLNDAIALNGLLGEAVSFGEAYAVAESAAARASDKPKSLEVADSIELPLGLAQNQAVSQFKVVSGGEVLSRSAREKGHLISQRIEDYSLERIII